MRFYRQDMQNVLLREEVKTPIHIFDEIKLNEKNVQWYIWIIG
jgi:hypothetical protein